MFQYHGGSDAGGSMVGGSLIQFGKHCLSAFKACFLHELVESIDNFLFEKDVFYDDLTTFV